MINNIIVSLDFSKILPFHFFIKISFVNFSSRLKRSVDYSRRPTTKVMLLRGDSSENGLTKRLSTSLANLDDVKRLSVLRQMPPTKIIPKMCKRNAVVLFICTAQFCIEIYLCY